MPRPRFASPAYIATGHHAELDACRTIAADSKGFLAGLQNQERQKTGISTLKVGFNRVFGYYFDVTKKHLDKVPDYFEQKQTLVNSCRFHTPELKEAETTILEAEEKAETLESAIFQGLLDQVGGAVARHSHGCAADGTDRSHVRVCRACRPAGLLLSSV